LRLPAPDRTLDFTLANAGFVLQMSRSGAGNSYSRVTGRPDGDAYRYPGPSTTTRGTWKSVLLTSVLTPTSRASAWALASCSGPA
jgi:hypothetical protein